jgi:hypothetical protein
MHLTSKKCWTIAVVFLTCLCSSASGEWARISYNESSSVYVDKSTKKRDGDLATVWVLVDFNTLQNPNGKARFRSMSSLAEMDCIRRFSRAIYTDIYSGQMGNGAIVKSSKGEAPGESSRPSPKSADELILNYACR